MIVEKHKGIDLLSEVALTEQAQYEEVRKKSLRDFHKTHLSGYGTVTNLLQVRDEDDSNNDRDSKSKGSDQESDNGDNNTQSDNEKGLDFEHETNENESGSESDQEDNEEDVEDDEKEKDDEFVKTSSNDSNDEDETNIKDKAEGDEDEEMDYTTNQFDDDVDLRMNEPVTTDEGLIQNEGTDAKMINSAYEAAALLTEFELMKIIIEKMDAIQSYLTAVEHKECYDGLIKSYDLEKSLLSTYDKVYSLKRSQLDKDKNKDPSAGPDRGLKKRKTSKDAGSTKEKPEFEVADSDMPQDQEENLGNDDEEPKRKVKENQEKDKIRSKPDKNGKRGEAGKSQKQLQ
nr:hypothetical protein [Tanacetum cinerariifolium]